jgi:hypothetical protein
MRAIHTLPLAAAILLAACGGDADADGDGSVSGEEIAAEAEGMVQPRPGQYRATLELLEFDAPGMPESAKQQMQEIFASGLSEGNSFCMTEADVAQNGPEEMVKNLAESDCTMNSFNVSGGTVVADMQCPGQGGVTSTVHMEGQMNAEGSTMTMDMSQEMPNVGATTMKMRVTSERTGDCAA